MSTHLKKAIIHSFFSKNISYAIQVIALIVTTRLFTPQEFGVIASLTIFVQLFVLIGEGGVGTALISYADLTDKVRDCMFTVSLIIALFFTLLFYSLVPLLHVFFDIEYGISRIIFSGAIFFSLLSMIPLSILRRELNFILIGKIDVFLEILSIVVLFCLWFLKYKFEALCSRFLVIGLGRFVLLYINTSFSQIGRPKITTSLWMYRTFIRVSLYQFLYSLTNFIARNIDNIVVAKCFSILMLGVYDKAYQIMRYPMMLISIAISPAIQSVMSRDAEKDIKSVLEVHRKIERKILFYGVIISFFILINSNMIVLILFGNKWMMVSELLCIFSFATPVLLLQGVMGGFLQALKRTDQLFYIGIYSLFFNLVAIGFGVYYSSLVYMSIFLDFSFYVTYAITHYVVFSRIYGDRINPHVTNVVKMLFIFVIFSIVSVFFIDHYRALLSTWLSYIVVSNITFTLFVVLVFSIRNFSILKLEGF